MKEVKIGKYDHLRGKTSSVVVNDKDLTFINGLALIEGSMSFRMTVGTVMQKCYGVINEHYEEAFGDEYEGKAGRYLMFIGQNHHGYRVGANNFIISSNIVEYDTDIMLTQHRHIRVIDGKPTVMAMFEDIKRTFDQEIIIVNNNQLYDIEKGCFTSRVYSKIDITKDGRERNHQYAVTDIIYPKIDKLSFTIDKRDNITSSIFSNHYGYLSREGYSKQNYDDIVAYLRNEIKKEEDRQRKVVDGFVKVKI